MFRYGVLAGLVALLVSGGTALAAEKDHAGCVQSADLTLRIAACTRVIADKKHEPAMIRAAAYTVRGIAEDDKGDFDRAIADYTEAISLEPKNSDAFHAYFNRGNAEHAKGDFDRAIADYDESISLDPMDAKAYLGRGNIKESKGDHEAAIADYDKAISLDPKFADAYASRGHSYFNNGSVQKAQLDFKRANDLKPDAAYAAIWLEIAERRNNLPGNIVQTSKTLDMTKWPAPVVRLLLDKIKPAAVLAAADDPDPTVKKGQLCEANVYIAEVNQLSGDGDAAVRLYRAAVKDCPPGFVELDAAKAALRELGAP